MPAHDRLELGAVVEPKDLAHRAHVFPLHQQLVAVADCRSTCRRPIGPGSACRPAFPESCARRSLSRARRSGGWSPGWGDGRRRPDHTRGRVPTLNALPERVSDDRPGTCVPPIRGRIGSGGVTANRPAWSSYRFAGSGTNAAGAGLFATRSETFSRQSCTGALRCGCTAPRHSAPACPSRSPSNHVPTRRCLASASSVMICPKPSSLNTYNLPSAANRRRVKRSLEPNRQASLPVLASAATRIGPPVML